MSIQFAQNTTLVLRVIRKLAVEGLLRIEAFHLFPSSPRRPWSVRSRGEPYRPFSGHDQPAATAEPYEEHPSAAAGIYQTLFGVGSETPLPSTTAIPPTMTTQDHEAPFAPHTQDLLPSTGGVPEPETARRETHPDEMVQRSHLFEEELASEPESSADSALPEHPVEEPALSKVGGRATHDLKRSVPAVLLPTFMRANLQADTFRYFRGYSHPPMRAIGSLTEARASHRSPHVFPAETPVSIEMDTDVGFESDAVAQTWYRHQEALGMRPTMTIEEARRLHTQLTMGYRSPGTASRARVSQEFMEIPAHLSYVEAGELMRTKLGAVSLPPEPLPLSQKSASRSLHPDVPLLLPFFVAATMESMGFSALTPPRTAGAPISTPIPIQGRATHITQKSIDEKPRTTSKSMLQGEEHRIPTRSEVKATSGDSTAKQTPLTFPAGGFDSIRRDYSALEGIFSSLSPLSPGQSMHIADGSGGKTVVSQPISWPPIRSNGEEASDTSEFDEGDLEEAGGLSLEPRPRVGGESSSFHPLLRLPPPRRISPDEVTRNRSAQLSDLGPRSQRSAELRGTSHQQVEYKLEKESEVMVSPYVEPEGLTQTRKSDERELREQLRRFGRLLAEEARRFLGST